MAESRFVPSIYPHGDVHPRCPILVQSNTSLETVLRGRTLLACFEAIPAFKNSEEHERFHERNSILAMSGAWVFCADCNDILEGTLSYNGDLLSQALLNPTQTLDSLVERTIKIEKEAYCAQGQILENKGLNSPNLSALQKSEKALGNRDITLEDSYGNLVSYLNRLSYGAILEYIDRRTLSEVYGEQSRERCKGGAWIGRFSLISKGED